MGTLLVAGADGPAGLALGIGVAGVSAGLVYPPFADAVRDLPELVRARTLATVNCGTGWGVAIAAPIAIVAGDAWRTAYVGFAVCCLLSTLYAARVLPARATRAAGATTRPGLRRAALPMIAAALLVGLGSAAFWTFAVDHLRDGGLGSSTARAMLGLAGVTSVLGIGAADLLRRLGARRTFVLTALLEAAAIATIALAPGSVVCALLAGALFGAVYNTIVAVLALWATRIYADDPTAGLASSMGAQGVGLLAGPLAGGLVADLLDLRVALLAGAAVVAAAALLAPRDTVV